MPADLSREADIDHLFQATLEAFGTLDAGAERRRDAYDLAQHVTLEQWNRLATIARAAFLGPRCLRDGTEARGRAPLYLDRRRAAGAPHGVPYDAAKAAVDGWCNLACDYGLQDRVNGIAQGDAALAEEPRPRPAEGPFELAAPVPADATARPAAASYHR